jgi:hypothetical protein
LCSFRAPLHRDALGKNFVSNINPSAENESGNAFLPPPSPVISHRNDNKRRHNRTAPATAAGEASYTTSALAGVINTITAEYNGNQTNAKSNSNTINQVIEQS